jgi:hypothetical protein
MAEMELSIPEQTALALLRNTPQEIQKLARPDGTISLDTLYEYFQSLARKLEYAKIRRRNEYIDVEKKEIPNAVEHYAQAQDTQ